MPGQGVIVGVGTIDYPAEFQGADRRNLGVARRQQGRHDHQHVRPPHHPGRRERACSSSACTSCCSASTASTTTSSIASACRTRRSSGDPTSTRSTAKRRCCQADAVAKLIRVHRVRGHLIADLDPLRWKEPHTPVELDPATYGLTIWDLDREFLTGGVGGFDKMTLGDLLGVLRDAYCRTIGVEYMHIQDTDEQRWIQSKVEVHAAGVRPRSRRTGSSSGSTPPRRSRSSSPPSTSAPSGSASKAPSRRSRSSTRSSRRRPTPGFESACARHGPPRPAQRAVEHHRQELRGDLLRVRGPRRPQLGAGLGRRQVPPRRDRQVRQPDGRRHPGRAGRQPEPPRDRRPDRAGHGRAPSRTSIEPPGSYPGAADPDPRRRRLRRPGHRRRDAWR